MRQPYSRVTLVPRAMMTGRNELGRASVVDQRRIGWVNPQGSARRLPIVTEGFVPTEASIRRAVRRARDGVSLDPVEAEVLLHARGEQLEALFEAAGRVRDQGLVSAGRPGVITYSKSVFIPLTKLCRDRCHYCTFATVPHRLPAAYLSPDEVLEIARAGAAQGCKEALFTLGDRPEDRWPQAKAWLDERGYESTVDYLRAGAGGELGATGL